MDNENFFPTEDYKVPTTSNYMKLSEGEHTFRVLSSAIIGWEYFSTENKPIRSREQFEERPDDLKKDGRINHFWAFVVWNYEEKRVQILEITQKSIMQPIQALVKNPKWGNPKGYDISITRKGTGLLDTEYSVIPNPHSEIPEEAANKFMGMDVNLEALYEAKEPFGK